MKCPYCHRPIYDIQAGTRRQYCSAACAIITTAIKKHKQGPQTLTLFNV